MIPTDDAFLAPRRIVRRSSYERRRQALDLGSALPAKAR